MGLGLIVNDLPTPPVPFCPLFRARHSPEPLLPRAPWSARFRGQSRVGSRGERGRMRRIESGTGRRVNGRVYRGKLNIEGYRELFSNKPVIRKLLSAPVEGDLVAAFPLREAVQFFSSRSKRSDIGVGSSSSDQLRSGVTRHADYRLDGNETGQWNLFKKEACSTRRERDGHGNEKGKNFSAKLGAPEGSRCRAKICESSGSVGSQKFRGIRSCRFPSSKIPGNSFYS